ncbi:MAG: hypothetical protein JWO13_36 [Acidobacteriales bacterium]|nr:hypothetical protein [Terriglobales bacterium]
MKKSLVLLTVMLLSATLAQAELRHVELSVFGMD